MNPIATPTPLPDVVATPIVSLDLSEYTVWNYSDDLIQAWNKGNDMAQIGTAIQVAIVLILIFFFVLFMIPMIRGLMRSDTL